MFYPLMFLYIYLQMFLFILVAPVDGSPPTDENEPFLFGYVETKCSLHFDGICGMIFVIFYMLFAILLSEK